MSETPVYFALAQLNSLMTGSLRLALAMLALSALAGMVSLRLPRWLALGPYFGAWCLLSALVGLTAAGLLVQMLPYDNPFVWQGLRTAAGLSLGAAALLALQLSRLWRLPALRLGHGLIAGLGLGLCAWLPSFSRSDKVLLSTLSVLPFAIALSYFPLLLLPGSRRWRGCFHALWLPAAVSGLLLHHLWLYPLLAGIPQQGEFFPYINLYDWFLFVSVILYSGNLYVDYWLSSRLSSRQAAPRAASSPRTEPANQPERDYDPISSGAAGTPLLPSDGLALSWNYLVLAVSIICLWLNANVFDTLAL